MSTFEALKLAYVRSTGKDEPGVLALLAFGSISGSVGATSVYPLNLVRTRLQASGSTGHPQIYTGVWDVASKTWERDGWRGFYRGLFPTLAKVGVLFFDKTGSYGPLGCPSGVNFLHGLRAKQAAVRIGICDTICFLISFPDSGCKLDCIERTVSWLLSLTYMYP